MKLMLKNNNSTSNNIKIPTVQQNCIKGKYSNCNLFYQQTFHYYNPIIYSYSMISNHNNGKDMVAHNYISYTKLTHFPQMPSDCNNYII